MSTDKTPFFEMHLTPEISARRVSGLMQFFIKERGIQNENPFSEFLDEEIVEKILNDSSLWISQELEERIISFLSDVEDISPALYQIGKETFLAQAYELLPTNIRSLNIHEFIVRLPIMLSKLTRTIRLEVENLESNHAIFLFQYQGKTKEKWYDIIFFKGMLDGLSMLFELTNFKTILEETKLLGIHVQHRDLGDKIRFGSDRNIYRIEWEKSKTKVARTNLNSNLDSKKQKTFVLTRDIGNSEEELSVLNLSSVINKSRELALENRDLEAAVEVLKSFKNELEIKQKSIAKDLKLAKNIQRGIIPQSIPDWKGIQFWYCFSPMQEVSGDYYDFFPFDETKMGIAVCDVSGHGVPAAFITALSKMLFTTYRSPSPSNIFKNVNRDLLELLQNQGYTTCIYAVINEDYTITYSVAGHPRPIILKYKTGKAEFLPGDGTFLGMFPEANDYFEDHKVLMEPGDKIYFYTDGITEAFSEAGEAFGDERLLSAVSKTQNMTIREAIEFISSCVFEHTMGTDQGDDITILGFELSREIEKFRSLMLEGNDFYSAKKYGLAVERYLLAHKLMPREISNVLALSKSLAKEKKFQSAIEYLLEYHKYKIHDYESHFVLGYCYFQLKDFKKAETELKKALYIDDSHFSVYYNLVRLYHRLNDKEKLKSYLEKMKKRFPNFGRYSELDALVVNP